MVPAAIPYGSWRIDPTRSSASFQVPRLRLESVRGRLGGIEGEIVSAPDSSSPLARGTVAVATLATGRSRTDARLLATDLLDAAGYPLIHFVARWIPIAGHRGRPLVELAIRGEARPLELIAQIERDEAGRSGPIVIEATGSLDRRDFVLNGRGPFGLGDRLVGGIVELDIRLVACRR